MIAETAGATPAAGPKSSPDWWRHGTFYQIYPWSFADSNGDGVGDLAGIRSRIPHLSSLGVDAVWITPWFPSPLADGGYDVTDYFSVHPSLGTMEDLERLISDAAEADIGVLFDLVANHTSDRHPRFQKALAAGPGSPERAWYHFLPPTPDGRPPNDWQGSFGGPAWTRVADGEWYLHSFDRSQPDLNWGNPAVRDFFDEVIRFWVGKGVAGFRADVAHGLEKDPDYRPIATFDPVTEGHPLRDRDEVHTHIRRWRRLLDSYPDRHLLMVAEVVAPTWERRTRYLRPDEYHQIFNHPYIKTPWDAEALRLVISESIDHAASVGAVPTWVLSNHDEVRHPTRLGLPQDIDPAAWLLNGDRALLDEDLGRRRARAIALLTLALPGSHYIYQGDELGLPEAHDLPVDVLTDPTWERSGHTMKGRDGCRVPIPWTADEPGLGFTTGTPWLPIPRTWGALSVAAQEHAEGSMLSLYRTALELRRTHLRHDAFEWIDSEIVTFSRGDITCVVNPTSDPVQLPDGEVLIASQAIDGGSLPGDAAAWVRTTD